MNDLTLFDQLEVIPAINRWHNTTGLQGADLKDHKFQAGRLNRRILDRRWYGMIERCYNQKNTRYKCYGARGITVCDEWRNNKISFFDWAIKNGFHESLEIDRRNNDGNYEPGNCHWITRQKNSLNKRKRSDFGIMKVKNRYQVNLGNFNKHHFGGSFITIEEARINRDKLYRILHCDSNETMNPSKYHWWKDEEIEIIKKEYPNTLTSGLAKKLGFTEDQVRGKAAELGLKKTKEAWVESHIIHGKYRQIR